MKKSVIISSVILAACMCQAASITWKSTPYKVVGDDGNPTASISGSIVLVKIDDISSFKAGNWSAKAGTVTELANATVNSEKNVGLVTGQYEFNYATSIIKDGDYVAAVLKDSDGTYAQLHYPDKDNELGLAVTNYLQVAELSEMYAKDFNFATEGNFLAAPEPSSAMLLMLGLAGLALKRKRRA